MVDGEGSAAVNRESIALLFQSGSFYAHFHCTSNGYGKEGHGVAGTGSFSESSHVENYWLCRGGFSVVNTIGKRLREMMNLGLA